jgi:hypothetical protein
MDGWKTGKGILHPTNHFTQLYEQYLLASPRERGERGEGEREREERERERATQLQPDQMIPKINGILAVSGVGSGYVDSLSARSS